MLHAQEDILVRCRRVKAVFASYLGTAMFSIDTTVARRQNEYRHNDHGICVKPIFLTKSAVFYGCLEGKSFWCARLIIFYSRHDNSVRSALDYRIDSMFECFQQACVTYIKFRRHTEKSPLRSPCTISLHSSR